MTNKEAKQEIEFLLKMIGNEPPEDCDYTDEWIDTNDKIREAYKIAIKALEEKEYCDERIHELEDSNDSLNYDLTNALKKIAKIFEAKDDYTKLVIEIPENFYKGILILKNKDNIKYEDTVQLPLEVLANAKTIDDI